ncbi:ATP synthase subunit epsilon [Photobacterium damselae subsp. damselae CIP 102761]|uniref:ATP synthase subunit epsilon n=4 Tax=Photobacterium damselae TaxID=38293 RepID=D0Z3U7_PHODD|nr:ATP synthase subunit epsilon [Photobacterium damselae subsp. damselae CIP 102761]
MHGKDIDKARADEARRAAEENINKHADDVNFAQAQMELAKAMAQLRAVELTQQVRR